MVYLWGGGWEQGALRRYLHHRLGSRTSVLEWKVEDLENKVDSMEVVVSLLTIIVVALFGVLCAVVVK